ncbi:SF1B family DNA helicase RecD2 [Marinococcus luteus]|uniref:SF1B family DNA helicase RecD2 n=1 Tax=Marinococcus luteus TaxID=1122204 RepID=UPI002ACCB9E4|nr:ATP-dependent RecD-like DNA helicase [Marinococcus luteus]MDZ5782898.1 ATP-dependent RecD-like DNA helicase [Marinococcus luteus]
MENGHGEQELLEPYVLGTVQHVIFRNEENGYTVAKVKIKESIPAFEESTTTIVGILPTVEANERYRFNGEIKQHPRFGTQYQVISYQKEIPTERSALIDYLSSDRFPYIGPKTAEKLVDRFGARVIDEVLERPEALEKIPGLNEEKRRQIRTAMLENQGMEHAMTLLVRYGFGTDLGVKIYNQYRERTLDIIQHDPYQLVWDVDGVGFTKADRLGENTGIQKNDPSRLKAGVLFELYERTMQDGHVYIPKQQLLDSAEQLLADPAVTIDQQELKLVLQELVNEERVQIDDDRVYIASLYFAEKGFAGRVHKLQEEAEEKEYSQADLLQALGEVEEKFDIEYAEQQKEAIQTAMEEPVMLLTGGPGTGKTTIIRAIVEVYASLYDVSLDPSEYSGKKPFPVLLAAPTGRAAKRMKESTGLRAVTIHKLLGFSGEGENELFEKDEYEPLEGELLIVDEVSMVDMWLANQLIRAVPKGMKVVFVGDEDQLPSVGPGQVLGDLLEAGTIPTVSLSVVYRQTNQSSIVELAHAMKEGGLPDDFEQPFEDRRFFPCTKAQVADVVEKTCAGAIRKGYDPMDIQVLAPMYRGEAGIHALNERLQEMFNPRTPQKRSVTFGDAVYQKDDIVLQLVNNGEEGIYNGDKGVLETVFEAKETVDKEMQIVFSFDEKEVSYTRQDLKQITLAYCTSIHKAQGSEFPIVVVPMLMSYRRMLRRNLLYTAITRAKDYLILCGEKEAFMYAVKQESKNERYSHLRARLKNREEDPEEQA